MYGTIPINNSRWKKVQTRTWLYISKLRTVAWSISIDGPYGTAIVASVFLKYWTYLVRHDEVSLQWLRFYFTGSPTVTVGNEFNASTTDQSFLPYHMYGTIRISFYHRVIKTSLIGLGLADWCRDTVFQTKSFMLMAHKLWGIFFWGTNLRI